MNDSENIKMYLNIGGQRVSLTVPFSRQNFVRDVEKDVDSLYSKWRLAFPAKTDREIFAMVAYQYASFYAELKARYDKASEIAGRCLREIDADIALCDGDNRDTAD